jgi:hypothetical protein
VEKVAAKPSLEQMLTALTNQLLAGKSYLTIANGLTSADPVILATGKLFFGLTVEGNLQLAQIYAARLYDKTKGALTMFSLVSAVKLAAHDPMHSSKQTDLLQAASEIESRIAGLESILSSIKKRRDKAFAHLDPAFLDPHKLAASAVLSLEDLGTVYEKTGQMINEVTVVLRDTVGHFELFGIHDYETVLSLIADAKCAQVQKYEEEFGQPAPFDRPKNCPKPE